MQQDHPVGQMGTSPADRRQLRQFVALTFAISWLLWLPSVLRSTGMVDLPEIVGLLGLFAVLGPTVAAFVLVGRQSGRAGMGRLLRRAFATNFDKRWWLPTRWLPRGRGYRESSVRGRANQSATRLNGRKMRLPIAPGGGESMTRGLNCSTSARPPQSSTWSRSPKGTRNR